MTFRSVLIVGATSAIAHATARALVSSYQTFVLAARNTQRLEAVRGDLLARGAQQVHTLSYDAERDTHRDLIAEATELLLGTVPDAVLIAHGVLPVHENIVHDTERTVSVLTVNTASVLALCSCVCRHFEERGWGLLAVISSVAADRGRMVSYLYSASKAALDVYLDGLRLRWRSISKELRVLTIKPGYVRTPMTAHLEQMLFAASPQRVGSSIARLMLHRAQGRRYIPWWWRLVMTLVRMLPERLMLLIRQ